MSNSDNQKRIGMIKSLARDEADMINRLLDVKAEYGKKFLLDALDSFSRFLQSTKPNYIRPMDIEYRTFVIEILSCIKEIHKPEVIKTLLFP